MEGLGRAEVADRARVGHEQLLVGQPHVQVGGGRLPAPRLRKRLAGWMFTEWKAPAVAWAGSYFWYCTWIGSSLMRLDAPTALSKSVKN